MNEELLKPPSSSEIKEAMFAIHPDKAHGPDGFSARFFQANWEVVGPSIIREVSLFFSSGSLPNHLNEKHFRLIPKIQGPRKVIYYGPIVLCNVHYKVISKMLSLRLKPILKSIISENQSAFISGRAILDNVLITHATLHYLKTSSAQINVSVAVKTDMSKAYDRIEWNFIEEVFQRLGFHDTFTNWVMQYVVTMSYSFLLNDSVYGTISPHRGIRQGDPISPYIFILCGEVISGLCKVAQ